MKILRLAKVGNVVALFATYFLLIPFTAIALRHVHYVGTTSSDGITRLFTLRVRTIGEQFMARISKCCTLYHHHLLRGWMDPDWIVT